MAAVATCLSLRLFLLLLSSLRPGLRKHPHVLAAVREKARVPARALALLEELAQPRLERAEEEGRPRRRLVEEPRVDSSSAAAGGLFAVLLRRRGWRGRRGRGLLLLLLLLLLLELQLDLLPDLRLLLLELLLLLLFELELLLVLVVLLLVVVPESAVAVVFVGVGFGSGGGVVFFFCSSLFFHRVEEGARVPSAALALQPEPAGDCPVGAEGGMLVGSVGVLGLGVLLLLLFVRVFFLKGRESGGRSV